MSGSEYSLYIHVPFCRKKCGYCHFYVLPYQESLVTQFLEGLKREVALRSPLFAEGRLASIYLGGGTPSLLGPEGIAKILSLLPPHQNIEVTLEVNPEGITESLMTQFAAIGINRVSLGVQSLDDALLTTLTRDHSSQTAIDAILATKKGGIDNISIDLMYDIPFQTLISWENTLQRLSSLPITHLSLYNLTIEPFTSFHKKRAHLIAHIPHEDLSLQLLKRACTHLPSLGLHRYEISAFAKKGFTSHHNTGYWTGRPFLGLGPSAFSYWNHSRFQNTPHLKEYCTHLSQSLLPISFTETLPPTDQLKELLAIRLRLLDGTSPSHLPPDTLQTLLILSTEGLLSHTQGHFSLTERGTLFYDTIASHLIA